ncbi:MAG TPA: alpha/beta hydrolase [Nitrososphaeraceae archaeon]|jgi:phospholipase/carboxylesterase|nr:alpha/beta hydrolase [Thermoproteota archaeon]HZA62018.1 alpha/beta hydrolase [Nitrososphaeraceae archaeon]
MDKKPHQLGFIHRFIPSNRKEAKAKTPLATLLLLHGTGGNEEDMIPLGHEIAPEAAILSPRGKVLEAGMPRFFRRLAEGVFDIEDLKFRTNELADFIENASKLYSFDLEYMIAVGYSNGANIASSLLLLRPEILSAAILFRPMVPFIPDTLQNLISKNILICAGEWDPIVPRQNTEKLLDIFKKAHTNVSIYWQKSGHELGQEEILTAKEWLSHHISL